MFQRIDGSPTKGYQLLNLGSHWEFKTPSGIMTGGLKQICTYAVISLGFQFKELEMAVEEMEKQFHDGAEFGIYKSFMFTFDKTEKFGKINTTIH